jgi:hypothetical protein
MYDGKEVEIGAGGISAAEWARLQGSVVARGRALGEEIQHRTSDEGLKIALAGSVRESESLREVSVSGLVSSLHSAHRA